MDKFKIFLPFCLVLSIYFFRKSFQSSNKIKIFLPFCLVLSIFLFPLRGNTADNLLCEPQAIILYGEIEECSRYADAKDEKSDCLETKNVMRYDYITDQVENQDSIVNDHIERYLSGYKIYQGKPFYDFNGDWYKVETATASPSLLYQSLDLSTLQRIWSFFTGRKVIAQQTDFPSGAGDGHAYTFTGGVGTGVNFYALRNRAGSGSAYLANYLKWELTADAVAYDNLYRDLYRINFQFDLSGRPAGEITNAVFHVTTNASGSSDPGYGIAFNIYPFTPDTFGQTVNADYLNSSYTEYSSEIAIAGLGASGEDNGFTFNSNGLTALNGLSGNEFSISLLESNFDGASTSPTWTASRQAYAYFNPSETTGTEYDPYLYIETGENYLPEEIPDDMPYTSEIDEITVKSEFYPSATSSTANQTEYRQIKIPFILWLVIFFLLYVFFDRLILEILIRYRESRTRDI